jgi:PAS domain S-box-containing protein
MIWYKDTKNNFVRINPAGARAFGMAIEEIEGKNTYDLFPDFAEKYCEDDQEVINSGKPRLGIIEPMTTASGENLWVQSDKIPLKDEEGNITGILVFVVDITERKRAEDALALASRKLTLLSSITRHDIINQLLALNGYLELSRDILGDPVKLAEFITKEQNIARTIEAQIRFTKDYQDVGIKAPVWQNVHDSVAAAKERLPLRGIAVDTGSSTFEVYADPLLVRVFYNLIDNALRYGSEQMTTIRISSRESDRGLLVICEDDGVGIPADKKEAIFNRGYFKHTGFGLFLSREILSITGITITENGVPGKGARFEIHVPAGMWRKKGANE